MLLVIKKCYINKKWSKPKTVACNDKFHSLCHYRKETLASFYETIYTTFVFDYFILTIIMAINKSSGV